MSLPSVEQIINAHVHFALLIPAGSMNAQLITYAAPTTVVAAIMIVFPSPGQQLPHQISLRNKK